MLNISSLISRVLPSSAPVLQTVSLATFSSTPVTLSDDAAMSKFFQDRDIVNIPPPPADRLPTPWEHAVGANRHELIAERAGHSRYHNTSYEVDYGTMKNPVEVPTYNPERVIGCRGPEGILFYFYSLSRNGT